MKKFFSNIAFLCFVILFCFIVGEVLIRVFYSEFSNYNMEMWRYAAELKKPLLSDKLPFHHFANRQGSYYGVTIKTNSLGFRDYEYDIDKSKDKKRIIFLGDSFTLGWGVPFENIFSKQLEKMLNKEEKKFEVINMGTGNYNSIMELELFKLKGLKLTPDLVILMYFINDVEPTPERLFVFEYFLKKHSYFYGFLSDRYIKLKFRLDEDFNWKQYYSHLYSPNSKSLSENKDAINELFALCNEKEIDVLVVNIPELHDLKEYPFLFASDHIKILAREADVVFLDLLPALSGYDLLSLWVSPEDSHANIKANSIIAERIYKEIKSKDLL